MGRGGRGFLRVKADWEHWREGSSQPQFPKAQASPLLEEVGSPHESQGSPVREAAAPTETKG